MVCISEALNHTHFLEPIFLTRVFFLVSTVERSGKGDCEKQPGAFLKTFWKIENHFYKIQVKLVKIKNIDF